MITLKKNLRLVKEQKREPSPSLLVGIGLRTAHIIWGRVGFTQKLVLTSTLLNSRKDRRKDEKMERRKDRKTERRSFFGRCRRIYVFNKK